MKSPDLRWLPGLQVLTEDKLAYSYTRLGAELRARKRGWHLYHFSRETFYPQSYGIALPRGAPYRAVMDQT